MSNVDPFESYCAERGFKDDLPSDILEEFQQANLHLFYGQYYCGDNTQHAWLPLDYGENEGVSSGDYLELHYVRLWKEIDPEQRVYGYALFHFQEGILELGDIHALRCDYSGEYDLDYTPLVEITLAADLKDLRFQLEQNRK